MSIFDVNKPRLAAVTAPLRGEDDDIYSFKLDLGADGYTGKKLALNAVANAQAWHRRLGRPNKRCLELINGQNGNGVAFDGSMRTVTSARWVKVTRWLNPKKANASPLMCPFCSCKETS